MAAGEQRPMTAAPRWRRLVAAIRTAVMAPVFVVTTLVAATLVVAMSLLRRDAPATDGVVRMWSRVFLACAPARLSVQGRQLIDPDRQYVFVANHLSNLDIPAMFLTLPVPIRYLAKKEIYRIPVVAQAMNALGMIEIDRTAGGRTHTAINRRVEHAKTRGHSLIIFPEGTRSTSGRLGGFKKGAFRIAVGAGMPVVPVTIEGTWEMWPPGAKFLHPGRVRVTIHPPIPTGGLGLGDITGLRDRARTTIEGGLATDR